MARSKQAEWPSVPSQGRRAQSGDLPDQRSRVVRSRHRGRVDAGTRLSAHGEDRLRAARQQAGPDVVSRPIHTHEPAPEVRPGDSGHHRRPRDRHHRDAGAPSAARWRDAHLVVFRVDGGGRRGAAQLDAGVPDVARGERARKGGIEERQQPRDVVRRPGRVAGALRRRHDARPPHARTIAAAHRDADRSGRPATARARAHARVGLQHLQPARVLRPGPPRRVHWRGSLESPHRGRPESAPGRRFSRPLRSRRPRVAVRPDHGVPAERAGTGRPPRRGRLEGAEVPRSGRSLGQAKRPRSSSPRRNGWGRV